MPRNTFSDIVPPKERRSIRNISRSGKSAPPPPPPQEAERPPQSPHEEVYEDDDAPPPPGMPPHMHERDGFFSRYGMWIVALVVLLLLVFAFAVIFSGSKVVVTPKQKDVTVNGEFSAFREPELNALAFEVMELEDAATETLEATGTENVEERASGRIVIYNDYSENSQRLVTNTRFETPDGLIYRVREPVVVPGKSGETPGQIEVAVYADEPGETYNIDRTDFTIPGFKGSPQFDSMYARSQTPMTGGFVGERVAVEESALTAAAGRLESTLRNSFIEKARTELPEGYLLFDNAVMIEVDAPRVQEGSSEGEAIVELKGTAYAVIFKENNLAESVAQNTVAAYENEPVTFESTDSLNLEVVNKEEAVFAPETSEEFTFNLSGNARIVWLFDEAQLKQDLSGQPKEAVNTILPGHKGIDKAQVILRPFWKREFPDDPDKILIEVAGSE